MCVFLKNIGVAREHVRRTSTRIKASRVLSQLNSSGSEETSQDLRLAFSSINSSGQKVNLVFSPSDYVTFDVEYVLFIDIYIYVNNDRKDHRD